MRQALCGPEMKNNQHTEQVLLRCIQLRRLANQRLPLSGYASLIWLHFVGLFFRDSILSLLTICLLINIRKSHPKKRIFAEQQWK